MAPEDPEGRDKERELGIRVGLVRKKGNIVDKKERG